MAGDRARITHYAPRHYREVVSMQGRVMLEADWNEGQRIFTEQQRLQALDVVGPWGTPDDGYRISAPPANFIIGPGTMYTGGLRTTLEAAISYGEQPDWLDTAQPQPWSDGLWRPPGELERGSWHLLLLLREQELVATEDPALREVALGGPDTAARTRLLQRIVAMATDHRDCDGAADSTSKLWAAQGLEYDSDSATLRSRARLRVTMVSNPPAPSPCDPPAASGYLGADNQMLRVQVVAFDGATGKGKLLWAYHNGSTLYRCRVLDASTIELQSRPVSSEYQPRVGGVVQVLMSAAELGEGAYAAALTGHWATLSAAYDADTRRITLPAALPGVLTGGLKHPLFLRLWEQELDFSIDVPVALTGTGLQVTLSRTAAGALPLGDYWSFGVRPATPNAVYPERYLVTPQPPEGPRQWASPLAVLAATAGAGVQLTDDCRRPFDNLVELTARQPDDDENDSCCCLTVTPEQAPDLQRIVDKAVQGNAGRVTLHLQAGQYPLPAPLRLDKRHAGLRIAPCTGARPILLAADADNPAFSYGLVLMLETADISLAGIDFRITAARFDDELRGPFESAGADLPLEGWKPERWGVGLHIVSCREIAIDDCRFHFPRGVASSFSAGVLLQGENGQARRGDTLALRGCDFIGLGSSGAESIVLGICLAPLLRDGSGELQGGTVARLLIEQCHFARLDVAILLVGQTEHLDLDASGSQQVRASLWQLGFDDRVRHSRDLTALIDQRAGASPSLKKLWSQTLREPQLIRALCATLLMAPGSLSVGAGQERAASAPMRINIRANHFDSSRGDEERASFDTMVWDLSGELAHLLVTGNSFVNRGGLPTLAAALDGAFNITGNAIENLSAAVPGAAVPAALLVQPRDERERSSRFTVTGNTIIGSTNLAQFPRAEWRGRMPQGFEPMLTWEFFNAIG